ncbi:AfsR/SARP family transcriptional regulator [Fodinicola feengrottensis]|uniref:AfsR/SARP family transcriptional regulator n=1 Tax=Fodinicola feengrottensis TaxID=435914 RepID=UPI0013D7D11E|nr:AfsR/SARP family transcriptional regulator [Fodinicola feengrottensis]
MPIREVVATNWDEVYLGAVEDFLDARIERGEHASVIADLTVHVRRYPGRERLCGQLMTALYAAGRAAEALDLYRTVRRRLVDELGIEPGPSLQRLELAILRGDPTLLPRDRAHRPTCWPTSTAARGRPVPFANSRFR